MPRIHQISVSNGGVPKLPVPAAHVSSAGVQGDRQNDLKHHGGPDRAVCLYALSLIEALRAEGHPIAPGTAGENLTLSEITPDQWAALAPGSRLRSTSGVELEIASFCAPCSTIRASFSDSDSRRIKHELRPGWSRLYARVLTPGTLSVGQELTLHT